jgi:hypothetical protein
LGAKIVLLLLLAGVSRSAMAEWVDAGANGTQRLYYDPATIKKTGDMVKLWHLHDYSEAKDLAGKKYMSLRVLSEFDCWQNEFRIFNETYHADNMAGGDVLSTVSGPSKWQPVPRGSFNEILKKIACGKK